MWGTMRGDTLHITGLAAESTYMLYLVSTTTGNRPVENAVCYLFSTTPARPPIIYIVVCAANDRTKVCLGLLGRAEVEVAESVRPLLIASGTRNDFNSGRSYTSQNPSFNITTGNDYVLLVTAQGVNSEIPGESALPVRRSGRRPDGFRWSNHDSRR